MPAVKTKDQKKSSTANKTNSANKSGAVTKATMPGATSAREKAKDMDTKRRSDAESNEL